ncbi:LysE family translocator [Cupriavidus gilardii]|uniref:LysE family translocator n=1 Tax=Cupriavidus gilardii TaxID=82541 RepID=UPI0015724D81|nr:LysE family translocator [Cupriavidus gilardii]NSX04387.1 LysE family translocator [Cupriavidus gilardii]
MASLTLLLSMAAFALVSSITPGPVNIVALGAGAQHGLRASLRHVTGATVGFSVLLLLVGLGMHRLLTQWPALTTAIRWGGIAFLLFMAWKLATDEGRIEASGDGKGPSFLYGAAMQWLNPKAWLASVAGIGVYAADGTGVQVWRFAAIYFVVCYLSIACWAYAGAFLRAWLRDARRVRTFNRTMALLLAASALFLVEH